MMVIYVFLKMIRQNFITQITLPGIERTIAGSTYLVEVEDSDNKLEIEVEYFRSACLFTLNELILKYGQDMKNNQWVIEPFANMLCSLSIVDTALKKVSKISDNSKKEENTELLELSICQHYIILNLQEV